MKNLASYGIDPQQVQDTIACRRFVIPDAQGRIRVEIGLNGRNAPSVVFYDEQGRNQAYFGLMSWDELVNGRPAQLGLISLGSPGDGTSFGLAVTPDDAVEITAQEQGVACFRDGKNEWAGESPESSPPANEKYELLAVMERAIQQLRRQVATPGFRQTQAMAHE